MPDDPTDNRRQLLQNQIAASMEELRRLRLLPTLDDFQDFWRKRLELRLLGLREELREIDAIELRGTLTPLPPA